MGDTLHDFKVQMRIHELHPIKSSDLAEMIRIGLAVLQSGMIVDKRVRLAKGVNKIETAGRGWDIWKNPKHHTSEQTAKEGVNK